MFSVINTVLLRPLPFPYAQRIVFVWDTDPNRNVMRGVASPAEFLDWRDQNHSFEELSAWRTWYYNLTGAHEPEQIFGVHASANFTSAASSRSSAAISFQRKQVGHDQVRSLVMGCGGGALGGDLASLAKHLARRSPSPSSVFFLADSRSSALAVSSTSGCR
jgi:hypothetical protein